MKNCFNRKNIFVFLFILLLAAACTSSSDVGSDPICAVEVLGRPLVACTPSPDEGSASNEAQSTQEEMEHDEEVEHSDEHEHGEDDSLERVPNNGAAVQILSPVNGDTFQVGDEVPVEIELENFTLGEGNHWHIYVDGSSWGMVMGENTDDTLRGLEPGEHEISVYLSIDSHEELEDGDAVTIVVEE